MQPQIATIEDIFVFLRSFQTFLDTCALSSMSEAIFRRHLGNQIESLLL